MPAILETTWSAIVVLPCSLASAEVSTGLRSRAGTAFGPVVVVPLGVWVIALPLEFVPVGGGSDRESVRIVQ
jgi:hypothetical protein